MAQLVATPKALIDAMSFRDGEDFKDYLKHSDEAYLKLEAESAALPDGEVVGALISFPWADGSAIYRVVSAKPLKIQHIPYGDAWHVDAMTIRGLRLDDVLRKVRASRSLAALFPLRST